jgi:hypothetical protein
MLTVYFYINISNTIKVQYTHGYTAYEHAASDMIFPNF